MRGICLLLAAAGSAALGACGAHDDPAPIVYGTQPASTGRIYNSKTDYYRPNPPATQASLSTKAPAQLAPVAAVDRDELAPLSAPRPTYISASNAPAPRSGGRWVTVQPGDTVYAIARRTGASPQAIIAENHLAAPYALAIGDTLMIPDPEEKIANRLTQPASQAVRISTGGDRTHTVRRGDTLYSISRSTGVSVETLAQANGLLPPYTLAVGQMIRVPGDGGAIRHTAPIQREASVAAKGDVASLARAVSYTTSASQEPAKMFDWPVKGAIIGKFGSGAMGRRNDGVNIAAPVGTPVRAAADGEVVYRGAELEGYGNLLLIKHADGFVTAYAHNDVMLVKKGDIVQQGQIIAKVGQTGAATEPQLHFEIRQNLKSVDPLAFLEK